MAASQEVPPPGAIKLLPGYHHRVTQGVDSRTGLIWKEGGAQIRYDIGEMAGSYTECSWCGWTKDELWRKKQVLNGKEVVCVFTKKRRLIVSFPDERANFYATIRTQAELADMLLMIFTFDTDAKGG